tara:strand:+ start:6937 stop:7908 length:972 start_codon:yes stop_codon:yes gene_type:complete
MFETGTNDHLIRSQLWSTFLKEEFNDVLMGTGFVQMLSEFPDGDTFNIPSVGQATVENYVEGNAVNYRNLDTGNFTFTITEYVASGHAITEKMKQDSVYANQVISSFPAKQARAIAEKMEKDMFEKMNVGQTAGNVNLINGGRHRFVANDTVNTNFKTIGLEDFAKAHYSLKKAEVPLTNLVAVVDPSVAYHLNTLTNLVNVSNNPQWEGIITSGLSDQTGLKFIRNIYGFDVYVSNYLPTVGVETVDSVSTSAGAVANYFFSAAPEALPLIGAVRQAPKVDSEYNKDLQREEYVTTARWGMKLYRPESLVTVLSDDGANFVF